MSMPVTSALDQGVLSAEPPDLAPHTGPAALTDRPAELRGTAQQPAHEVSCLAEATPTPFQPATARYFDLVEDAFDLGPEERALLARNGFMLSDRNVFPDFTTAYAY